MTGIAVGGNMWIISSDERAKHDAQFFQLKPQNGYVTGEQARTFFLQSGLPMPVLGQIWALADMNTDGKMDKKEFSIAMHLIKNKLQGLELPKTLPASLKADPTPGSGAFSMPAASMGMGGVGMMPSGFGGGMPMSAGGMMGPSPSMGLMTMPRMSAATSLPGMMSTTSSSFQSHRPMGFGTGAGMPGGTFTAPNAATAVVSAPSDHGDWGVPQSSKLKYTQQFNIQDRMRKGFLTGMEARAILTSSGLSQSILAQIWGLSDIDTDGKLSCDEYVLAMHLIDMAKSGQTLPMKLPQELVPPRYRKGPQPGQAIGLPPASMTVAPAASGGFGGMPPAVPVNAGVMPAAAPIEEPLQQVSFEDRRKENFDRGQAELEKRRAALREMQEKEEEARRQKEREEREKEERKRMEQEAKKQAELERQMEKQRQIEMEREEARRKAMEQKEAARRELERQRQLEWERQRRDQLMAEKQREQLLVDKLQQEVSRLKIDLEAMDTKKDDAANRVQQARDSVTNITNAIDGMRGQRDQKIANIDAAQKDIQEWTMKLSSLQQERMGLENQVAAAIGDFGTSYKAIKSSYDNKKTNITKMKEKIDQMEKETEQKLKEIDENNAKLKEIKEKLNKVQAAHDELQAKRAEKKMEWLKMKGVPVEQQNGKADDWFDSNKTSTVNDTWGDSFGSTAAAPTDAATSNDTWGATTASADGRKSETKTLDDLWADFGSKDLFGGGVNSSQKQSSQGDVWGSDFSSILPASTNKEVDKPGYKKYQALYQFESRNPDEINLLPGDFVWVKDDQTGSEPGWLAGEKDGVEGVFPAAYAKCVENATGTPATPATNGASTVGGGGGTPATAGGGTGAGGEDAFFGTNFNPTTVTSQSMPKQSSMDSQPTPSIQASADSSFTTVTAPSGISPSQSANAVSEGVQAQALYPWRAKKDNHLTFDKGDIILVKEQQDMWCSGELNGKIGWFPKSYVKLFGAATPVTTTGNDLGGAPPPPVDTMTSSVSSPPGGSVPATPAGEQYLALYTYTSTEPGDLVFNQGDIITVTKIDGDWWTGTIQDRSGIFPGNYVKKLEDTPEVPNSIEVNQTVKENIPNISVQSPDSVPVLEQKQQMTLELENPPSHLPESQEAVAPLEENQQTVSAIPGGKSPEKHLKTSTSPATPDSPSLPKSGQKLSAGGKKPEIAQVIAAYQATGQEQLSLTPGQLIQVRKKSSSGWWEGELQARGQKRKIGWFPAQYVKNLGGSSTRSTPDSTRSATPHLSTSPVPGEGSRSATPVSYPAPTVAPAVEQVVALYNYQAQNDDELTFVKSAVINVLDNKDPDWWKGEYNGVTGLFPSNYVSPLSQAVPDAQASWHGNAVRSPTTPSSEVSGMERQRQLLIQELIDTEEQYVQDINLVKDVFISPLKKEGALTTAEIDLIFVNWKDIRMCNIKLLKAFRVRKRTCAGQYIHTIGDILCEFLPHMVHYVRFCSCQLNAANLLQKKSESDAKFKEVHKKCVTDPRAGGMPISSFLLKPMQRITKYPLLIQKILDHTPPEHSDHPNLQDALAKSQEVCSQVNEGVREKENSDRLEWIQTHVHCDGLPEKITFNSVTNSLGPRKLLFSGTLRKAKSGKELVGFLFNDFLLLAQPQRSLGSSASLFTMDTHAPTQLKMYYKPILLNEVSVKKTLEAESEESFHITHLDKIYSLKAVSSNERDSWVRKIEEASKNYLEVERKKREKADKAKKSKTVGRVLVVILEGCNLVLGEDGKSDPYCEVSMGAQELKTKVIPNSLNPKWNTSMQFTLKDVQQDVLCISVYDRDLFTPNDFLGRTEIRISDIYKETKQRMGPISKRLKLWEVDSGEVVVKLSLQLFSS